jgi:DNA-binding protein HU-beta
MTLTKAELVDKMAEAADISKVAAGKSLAAALDGIKASLKKGQKVSLVGFGTFSVSKRKARKGRNPKTGEAIKIPAAKVPKFTAGKDLKTAVK